MVKEEDSTKTVQQVTLNNGQSIPQLGFGTWKIKGDAAYESVKLALSLGYRYIDSAIVYGNEEEVGKAIKDSGINRKDITVLTKVPPKFMSYEGAKECVEESLKKMQLEYIDVYLLHWPAVDKIALDSDKHAEARKDAWRGLEEKVKEGKLHAIGVSNYLISHLEEMREYAVIPPVTNQVEYHPWLVQQELKDYCEKNNILITAYSPFASGEMMKDPKIHELAKITKRTAGQALIAWSYQQGMIVIPKSSNASRIKENLEAVTCCPPLSKEDIDQITAMFADTKKRICWDPTPIK